MRSVASAFATMVGVALSEVDAKTSTTFLEILEASSKKLPASNLAIIRFVLEASRFWRFAVKAEVDDTEIAVATSAAENFIMVLFQIRLEDLFVCFMKFVLRPFCDSLRLQE